MVPTLSALFVERVGFVNPRPNKKEERMLPLLRNVSNGRSVGPSTCRAARCAAVVVFWLHYDAVKRGGGREAAVHHVDVAQRIASVGTAGPGVACIHALEHYAGFGAGGQQPFVAVVIADRADVLIRETILHVLPSPARVRAAECAFS